MFIDESVLNRVITGGDIVKEHEIEVVLKNIPDEIVDVEIEHSEIQKYFDFDAWSQVIHTGMHYSTVVI